MVLEDFLSKYWGNPDEFFDYFWTAESITQPRILRGEI